MCDGMGMFPLLLERGGGGQQKRDLEAPDFLQSIPLRVFEIVICYRVVCTVGCVFPCMHYMLSAASLELLNLGLVVLDDQFFSSCAVHALGCQMCIVHSPGLESD